MLYNSSRCKIITFIPDWCPSCKFQFGNANEYVSAQSKVGLLDSPNTHLPTLSHYLILWVSNNAVYDVTKSWADYNGNLCCIWVLYSGFWLGYVWLFHIIMIELGHVLYTNREKEDTAQLSKDNSVLWFPRTRWWTIQYCLTHELADDSRLGNTKVMTERKTCM